jgi:very-short-patch-repair endonuclease
MRDGIPLAPVARMVADFGLTASGSDEIRVTVGAAVQRRLCTVAQIGRELDSGPRNGSRLLRSALADVGFGAHSMPEARAGTLLRHSGVTGFAQNAEVLAGGRRFVADFLWRSLLAILEIDSTEHHLSPLDHERTLRRDQVLQGAGYAVLHVTPRQLRDAAGFVGLVQSWLAALSVRRAGTLR